MSFLTIVTLFITITSVSTEISCRDKNGNPVDWFVAYKLPDLNGPKYSGFDFLYADGQSTYWSESQNINSTGCALTQTMLQYYKVKNDKRSLYVLYNDEPPPPQKVSSGKAHAKGAAVFDGTTGFWLVHSVPKFPPLDVYKYSSNGLRYGQSFLCITMKVESIGALAKQMVYMNPDFYDDQIPCEFSNRFPDLNHIFPRSRKHYRLNGTSSIVSFKSNGGVNFKSFSKSNKFNKDIYLNLIAPEVQSSLNAETWLNGPGDLPSSCGTKYKVMNVKQLQVKGAKFTNSHDHSKWAISQKSIKPIVCIGGVNRQKSQAKRGGGSVCFSNQPIWSLYDSIVTKTEPCNVRRAPAKNNKNQSLFGKIHVQINDLFKKIGIQ